MSLIGFLIWSLIVWLVGTKLMPEPATKADYPETFRVLGFAAAPGLASVLTIIGIIPILGWLIALLISLLIMVWQIAAMVIAVRQVLDYSTTGKAIVVVLIGFVINLCVTMLILAPLLGIRTADGLKGNRTSAFGVYIGRKRPQEEMLNAEC